MAQQSLLTLVDVAKASITAYNEKNFDKFRDLVANGAVFDEIATGRVVNGIDGILDLFRGWATALPDSKGTVLNEYLSDNIVVLELLWTGTHTGPLQTPNGTIPPTGKKINVRACQVCQFSRDKIQNMRHYFDMATLLKQLGVS